MRIDFIGVTKTSTLYLLMLLILNCVFTVEYKKHSRKNSTTFDVLFDENVYEAKRMWQYCQLWSRSIEVVYKAKSGKEILTRTYFPYDPHVSKPRLLIIVVYHA